MMAKTKRVQECFNSDTLTAMRCGNETNRVRRLSLWQEL